MNHATGRTPAGLVSRAADGFARAYGAAPSGVWAAPGRVNLMGEHTDYNRGLCLPIALPHRTFAAVSLRDDGCFRIRSAQEDAHWEGALADMGPGRPGGWVAYVAGVAWALAEFAQDLPGADIWVDGQVPAGAGLSSSAALECATALALDDLCGLGLGGTDAGRARLAAACGRAENIVVGAPTGGMDQSASMRCTQGHALLLDFDDGPAQQVPVDLSPAGLSWLVIDTRAAHQLVDGQYGARRRSCEDAAAALGLGSLREIRPADLAGALDRLPDDVSRQRVRHIVTEIQRVRETVVLLEGDAVQDLGRRLGQMLDTSHVSMRDDFEISCAELDLAVEAARAAGAAGARMTGGGFGGSAVALVPAGRSADIGRAVESAFAAAGFTTPNLLPVTASAGATRVL